VAFHLGDGPGVLGGGQSGGSRHGSSGDR
jgi:hypothetical protein